MQKKALAGIRIIDCSMWFAGPLTTLLLAQMGAEVIKIESIQAMDGWRGGLSIPDAGRIWETSPTYNSVNHNKFDVTLDLNHPKGVDIFKRLVEIGDVVVENYTPGSWKISDWIIPSLGTSTQRLSCCPCPGMAKQAHGKTSWPSPFWWRPFPESPR